MDGLSRSRFAEEGELLAEWESASNVLGPAKPAKSTTPEAPPSGGEIKPAA